MKFDQLKDLKLLRKMPNQERSRSLVKMIFEATTQVLASQSSANLTIEKLSARSGVSAGSIYQYFKNKKLLIKATFLVKSQELVDEIVAEHAQNAADSIELKTTLRVMLDNVVDRLIHEDGLFARLHPLLNGFGFTHFLLKFRNVYRLEILKVIRPWIKPGVSECKVEAVSYVIVNAILGVLSAHVNGYRFPFDKESLKEELFELLWNYAHPYLDESKLKE